MCWMESGEAVLIGSGLVQETIEKVRVIHERLLAAQSRQKSYANHKRRPLEFQIRDHVFFCVSPHKGVFQFGKMGSLLQDILVLLKSLKGLERLHTD